MSLEQCLARVVGSVPDCLAAGYVDMTSGTLLGAQTVDFPVQDVTELASATTGDLFQGPNLTSLERIFRKNRGMRDDGTPAFEEMMVMCDDLVHLLMRGKRQKERALIVIARRCANMGQVLTKSRAMLDEVEATGELGQILR